MNNVPLNDNREHRLIEAVVSLAKSFREERDRLAHRLRQLECEIDALALRLDQHQRENLETPLPAAPLPGPNRMPS